MLGLGGDHLTNDIAIGLRTPPVEAEKIKKRYGCAMSAMVSEDETIEVPSVGDRRARSLSRQTLCEIIEPRMEEIFGLVRREMEKAGYLEQIVSGVVITGGCTLLEGIVDLAEDIFGLPVRLGQPQSVGGLIDIVRSPMYATGVGLVLYGARVYDKDLAKRRESSMGMGRMRERVKRLFEEFF